MASNLVYQSNVSKFRNGKVVRRENIEKDLKLSQRTIERCIPKLINHGLIIEAKTKEGKVFVVNPYVVSVGTSISRTVYDLFRKSKWARW